MTQIEDADGTVIAVGDTVRQLNVHDAAKGALMSNAGNTGVVVALGRTRVQVQFKGRTRMRNFIRTDEPITDKVAGEWLRILSDETASR